MKLSQSVVMSRVVMHRGVKYLNTTCGFQPCSKKKIFSGVTPRHAGIRQEELWFCSAECFARSVLSRLTTVANTRVAQMPRHPRYSIGLVLMSQGCLTEDELRSALAHAEKNGEEIEVALVNLGLATECQIAAARAAQWGYPVFGQNCTSRPIEASLPATLLRAYATVPVHHSPAAKRFLMGFVYRVEHGLLSSVEQITGCRADPCFITASEYERQLDRLSAGSAYEEIVFEDRLSSLDIAETVLDYAEQIKARQAAFAECRDYFWMRLTGRLRKLDLLFRMEGRVQKPAIGNFASPRYGIRFAG